MVVTGVVFMVTVAFSANSRGSTLSQAMAAAFFVYAITEVPLFLDNTLARLPLAFIMIGVLTSSRDAKRELLSTRQIGQTQP